MKPVFKDSDGVFWVPRNIAARQLGVAPRVLDGMCLRERRLPTDAGHLATFYNAEDVTRRRLAGVTKRS